jgi:hypothetical protein
MGENRISCRDAECEIIAVGQNCKVPVFSCPPARWAAAGHKRGLCRGSIRLVCQENSVVIRKVVQFLALVLTALALVPGGAHLFAIANKISLAAEQYFIVQNIYRGWSLFGAVLIAALVANLLLAIMLRGRGRAFMLALVASLCIALTLVIFFTWTYPANQATNNWTTIPADWEYLRRQWEYSHAANALVTFVAFCAVTLSVLTARR